MKGSGNIMDSYRVQELKVEDLDKVRLPKFQRGLVWTKQKKEDFVQTLHDGYPFGTLLLYPLDKLDSEYELLDGQQRLSTIVEYRRNPLKFWKPLNKDEYERTLKLVNEKLGAKSELSESEFDEIANKTDRKLASWAIDATKEFEDASDRANALIDDIGRLKDGVQEFVVLKDLRIPAIVYLGKEEHIADVFANLNKGGTPLKKYEVFNASWNEQVIHLETYNVSPLQDEILRYVKQYYLDMQEKAEFEVADFSEDDLTDDRNISLAEFGTALGQYVVDHLPALIPNSKSATSEIGFGLLGVVEGIDNRKLNELIKYKDHIANNIETILQKTKSICGSLQSSFSVMLKRFKGDGDAYENGLSTTFKTLSYFAALWKLEQGSRDYTLSLRNIKAAYVYEAITSDWSSHGDQRLTGYLGHRNYFSPVKREEFRSAFDHWIDNQTPGINFNREVKCLVTIHANLSYLATAVPDGDSFELEHIIAKKRINDAEQGSRRILGSSLGNCMYLPRYDNVSKGTKTLYEAKDNEKYGRLIERSSYFTVEEFGRVAKALDTKDYDTINNLLKTRAMVISDELINALLSDSING